MQHELICLLRATQLSKQYNADRAALKQEQSSGVILIKAGLYEKIKSSESPSEHHYIHYEKVELMWFRNKLAKKGLITKIHRPDKREVEKEAEGNPEGAPKSVLRAALSCRSTEMWRKETLTLLNTIHGDVFYLSSYFFFVLQLQKSCHTV